MLRVVVSEERFDVGVEFERLVTGAGTGAGGIGSFVGVVRGGEVTAMTLEHYPGMTERAMDAIAAEAEQRFGLEACTVIHRVGRLQAGEPIVLVMAAATHRGGALAATGFLIDWLKTRAPFWKREERADGTAAWVEARDEDDTAALGWG